MREIKAFVGHSFTEDDDVVVNSFLSFFKSISELLPDFTWTHAKAAEPKELAEKVLDLIEKCNVFIAICTKKELVLKQATVRSTILLPGKRIFDSALVESKTSDWIIQEIGLAIGRKMSVIILLEEGCRRPGGLQGDVEFISFNRSAPEKAHNQLIEMLKALNPTEASSLGTTSGEAQEKKKGAPPSENTDSADSEPDETWDWERYENAHIWALFENDDEKAARIEQTFLDTSLASSDEDKAVWLSTAENWKIVIRGDGKISKLRHFAEEYPTNRKLWNNLAKALEQADEREGALEAYRREAECADEPADKQSPLLSISFLLAKLGRHNECLEVLDLAKNAEAKERKDDILAHAIYRLSNETSDPHLEIEAMEAIARVRPDDHSNRFSLAYAHSQQGNEDMALHHYLAIPASQRSGTAWNNLGVALHDFSMPAKAVDAYKKAADAGETLAMSNLAYRLMDAGFLDQAKTLIDEAFSADEPHRNVGEAFARHSDIPNQEGERLVEATTRLRPKIEFYRLAGDAILRPTIRSLGTNWVAPDCQLEVSVNNGRFTGKGEYVVKSGGMGGLLGNQTEKRYTLEFDGKIFGHRAYGKIERKAVGEEKFSLLGSAERERKFLAIFDTAQASARVAEDIASRSPKFYEITLQTDGDG